MTIEQKPEQPNISTMQIPVIMNRASIGDADHIFAVLMGLDKSPGVVAWVPRNKVTINKQPVSRELFGVLEVEVIERKSDESLVVIETNINELSKFWIDNETGRVIRNDGQKKYK